MFFRDAKDRGKFLNLFSIFKILVCFPLNQTADIFQIKLPVLQSFSPLMPVVTNDLKVHLLVRENEV